MCCVLDSVCCMFVFVLVRACEWVGGAYLLFADVKLDPMSPSLPMVHYLNSSLFLFETHQCFQGFHCLIYVPGIIVC